MKVLYITNKPIYPLVDGGCVAMNNFLKCLMYANIEIKHLLIETNKHPFDLNEYPKEITNKINPEGVFINTDVTPIKAAKGLITKGSYNVSRFFSAEMASLIVERLKESNYDCVIMESLYVTPYLEQIRENFTGKVFVRTHNVESEIWCDLATNAKNPLKSTYIKRLEKDLRKLEINVLSSVDGIMSISEEDSSRFEELGIKTKIEFIPVAVQSSEPIDNQGTNFFHLGSMNWQPNIDAVEKLVSIFPTIKKNIPQAELHIAGKDAEKHVCTDASLGVFVEGFVDDITLFANQNGILVSPISSGSGVRIKILEIMALGLPVITTTRGAQGINNDNNCLIIANSDNEIIENCIEIHNNAALRKEIGENALAYIRKNHNIESISSNLLQFITNA